MHRYQCAKYINRFRERKLFYIAFGTNEGDCPFAKRGAYRSPNHQPKGEERQEFSHGLMKKPTKNQPNRQHHQP